MNDLFPTSRRKTALVFAMLALSGYAVGDIAATLVRLFAG